MDYLIIVAIILVVILSEIYRRSKKKRTSKFIKSIELNYKNKFEIKGKVRFSKIHILLNTNLKIIYSENNMLVFGYDFYRHRNTNFIFCTDNKIITNKDNIIPNYLISEIHLIKGDKITLTSEEGYIITIPYKNQNKKEQYINSELFLNLLNKLAAKNL